jgi:ADP-ribosylglycohydrolase
MRVSPVGFAFNSIDEVLDVASRTAAVTHNHPKGIIGAQATALAIYLSRTGKDKSDIKHEITNRFGYDLDRTLDEIRPTYRFEISCEKSVPESIIAFLESNSVESAIRNAVSLGGDSDTMACIAGGIAQAFYTTIPQEIIDQTLSIIPEEFSIVIDKFNTRYNIDF